MTTFGAAKLEFSNYGAGEVGENYATKMKSSATLRTMVVWSHIYVKAPYDSKWQTQLKCCQTPGKESIIVRRLRTMGVPTSFR